MAPPRIQGDFFNDIRSNVVRTYCRVVQNTGGIAVVTWIDSEAGGHRQSTIRRGQCGLSTYPRRTDRRCTGDPLPFDAKAVCGDLPDTPNQATLPQSCTYRIAG